MAQYGVMIRGSTTAANAPYFAAFASPCQWLALSYRTSVGAAATVSYQRSTDCTNPANEQYGLGFTGSIQLMVRRTGNSGVIAVK